MEEFVDLREQIIAATVEIFTSMVMMEIAVSSTENVEYGKLENTITGVIGLAGTHKGVLAVHLPYAVAFAITGNFLGIELDEMNEDVEDAIGEIANMLGGNVKSILTEKGRDINLSLPSTISGKEYGFHTIKGAERIVIPFNCENGTFYVELQIEF
jgi:chemotaxis protein CheX